MDVTTRFVFFGFPLSLALLAYLAVRIAVAHALGVSGGAHPRPDSDMNEMVERVARAICVEDIGGDPDQLWNAEHPQPRWTLYVLHARAAIAAMPPPTEAIIDAALAE